MGSAFLAKYEITPDTSSRYLQSLKIEPGETPRELYVYLLSQMGEAREINS